MESQQGVATFLDADSLAMRSNNERMPLGAGDGPGRAKPALMRALSGSDSFDMVTMECECDGVWKRESGWSFESCGAHRQQK